MTHGNTDETLPGPEGLLLAGFFSCRSSLAPRPRPSFSHSTIDCTTRVLNDVANRTQLSHNPLGVQSLAGAAQRCDES